MSHLLASKEASFRYTVVATGPIPPEATKGKVDHIGYSATVNYKLKVIRNLAQQLPSKM